MRFSELIGAEKFAQGKLTYTDHFGGDGNRNTRIVIPAIFGHSVPVSTIVDTGALWSILNPEEARAIDSKYMEPSGLDKLNIRGSPYQGTLYRVPITLTAEPESGTDITVEATVFVPDIDAGEWKHPNFLGLDGFLDRLRFAIDPAENAFYFGAP